MRRVAILTALLLAFPLVVTGEESASAPVVTDPEGDVAYLFAEQQEGPATADGHGRADITSLAIEETADSLLFTVTVVDMEQYPPGSGQWVDAASLDIRFMLGDLFYNVRTGAYQDGLPFGEVRGGQADRSEPDIDTNLEATLDGSTFTVTVPRHYLRDHNGAPVQTGMQLTDLHVDSHVHATGLFLQNPDGSLMQPLGIRDRMPDTGSVSVDILLGGPITQGSIELEVPTPYRASNGGQATIAYAFTVTNTGEAPVSYHVHIEGAPESWDVEAPSALHLDAGQTVSSGLIVHTPFGHQHGGVEEFTLRLESAQDDATWAEATLGILYLAIPQPAGHHDGMWVHSTAIGSPNQELVQALGGSSGNLWMNTVDSQDDAQDQGADVPGIAYGPTPLTAESFQWFVCLSPHLQLGLDFDMNRTGTLDLALTAPASVTGTVEAEFIHIGPGDRLQSCAPGQWADRTTTVVATTPVSASADVANGQTFSLQIDPTAEGDFVPYAPGTDLGLAIKFTLDNPAPSARGPSLQSGAKMILPLNEYYDEHPAGVLHGDEHDDGHGHDEDAGDHGPSDTHESPAASAGLLLASMVAVLGLLRRRN